MAQPPPLGLSSPQRVSFRPHVKLLKWLNSSPQGVSLVLSCLFMPFPPLLGKLFSLSAPETACKSRPPWLRQQPHAQHLAAAPEAAADLRLLGMQWQAWQAHKHVIEPLKTST